MFRFSGVAVQFVKSALLIGALAATASAHATPPRDADDDDERAKPETEITITARRLDVARERVEPSLGASTYTLTNDAVENRPGGETTNLGRVLLQVPGVAQDGSGRLLVRGRSGLQYRINNVVIPEGAADLGERLSTRLADKVQLITGALPAQYGLASGGVVAITTKSGALQDGGQAELYGGSRHEIEPAFELAGSSGPTSLFASGSYSSSRLGLSSPDGSADPLHDRTHQIEGFAFADHIIDDASRVSLILGTTNEWFQVPNLRGLDAATYDAPAPFRRPLAVRGTSRFPSENLDARQRENSDYAIASYLRSDGPATLQASVFGLVSSVAYRPDGTGDLLFSGLSQSVERRESAAGLQVEGAWQAGPRHTIRGGAIADFASERETRDSMALPIDATGRQTSDQPMLFRELAHRTRGRFSTFLQDEWKPLAPLTVNAGLRFDRVGGEGGGTALSPRLNLVWSMKKGAAFHAGYARYFVPARQEGDVPDLVGTTGALPGVSSAPLRAQTDDYLDAGVQVAKGGLSLGLDAYWRRSKNFLDERRAGPPLASRSFNYALARSRGVELSLTYVGGPFSAWSSLAVAATRAKGIVSHQAYFTDAERAFAAGHWIRPEGDQRITASGGASWRIERLRLSASALYGSGFPQSAPLFGPGAGRLPAYVQVDLAAVYRIEGLRDRPLDIRFDVINAFDRRYQLRDGTGIGGHLPEWGPPRGFFLGVEQTF
ncbi:MAG: hypothetical protein JWO81_406 [Alphaproteobacteria bacterium]|nr:hypothetical protein [Alphaproteobacteria bacterium]